MKTNDGPRILIADNDEEVLIAMECALETGGYATATAISHHEASKLLQHNDFDLCVLDDYLSDKDSISALTEFRTTRSMPLVVVTYHRFPFPKEERQLRALGVSAFVSKTAQSQLVEIIAHLLEPLSRKSQDPFDDVT